MSVVYNEKAKRCRNGKRFVKCPPALEKSRPAKPASASYPSCERPAYAVGPRGGKIAIVHTRSDGLKSRVCQTKKGTYYIKNSKGQVTMISKAEYGRIVDGVKRLRAARFKRPKGVLAGLGLPVPLAANSLQEAVQEAAAVVPVRLPALDQARARAVANGESFSLLPSVPTVGFANGKQQNLFARPSAGISLTPTSGPVAALSKAIEVPVARTLEALEAPFRSRG